MSATSSWTILPPSVTVEPARSRPDLLSQPTLTALPDGVDVFAIDPADADTDALTQKYGLQPHNSANCVVVSGVRAGDERTAACVVLASTKADINKRVRKLLDVRKCSFLPHDRAVEATGQEYGGIGPFGLPAEWRVFVDSRVVAEPEIILGSGIRGSKLITSGAVLAAAPGIEVIEDLALDAPPA